MFATGSLNYPSLLLLDLEIWSKLGAFNPWIGSKSSWKLTLIQIHTHKNTKIYVTFPANSKSMILFLWVTYARMTTKSPFCLKSAHGYYVQAHVASVYIHNGF